MGLPVTKELAVLLNNGPIARWRRLATMFPSACLRAAVAAQVVLPPPVCEGGVNE